MPMMGNLGKRSMSRALTKVEISQRLRKYRPSQLSKRLAL